MTHIFMVVLTCVWASALNGPSSGCNEAHIRQPDFPVSDYSNISDPKVREIFQNFTSPLNLCTVVADEMMKNHRGENDPEPDGQVRVLKRYCQPEHDGPGYVIDLRTGQISVTAH